MAWLGTWAVLLLGAGCGGANTATRAPENEAPPPAHGGSGDGGDEGTWRKEPAERPGDEPAPTTAAAPEPEAKTEESVELDSLSVSGTSSGGGGSGYGRSGAGDVGATRGAGRPSPAAERDREAPKASSVPAKKEKARGGAADFGGGYDDESSPAPPPVAAPIGGPAPVSRTIAAPAMKAGRHDDNKQYNRFLQFLGENPGLATYPIDVGERILVRALDVNGKSLHNCKLVVKTVGGREVATATTFADGSSHFFPKDGGGADADWTVAADCGGKTRNGQVSRAGRREAELRFTTARVVPARVPVDIAMVFDTTGSMQSQIDRLKSTLRAIHFQLTQLSTKPDIRFALVAYRDRGDAYVTQVTNFTGDVDAYQRQVDTMDADGGGDTPEDLQSALADAMKELSWRPDALRLGFVIADAVPHTDYGQSYTYRDAMKESLRRGIKWTMVGAGGLPRQGEVIFRQIAQYTMGEYVFVTQSAAGDREGGIGEASHHVGTNYDTENLDQAIVRIVRRELSYLTDEPKDFDYTIVAQGDPTTPKDQVLAPAVKELLRQLIDYSSLKLEAQTPVAVVPVASTDAGYKDVAGYLSDELGLAVSREPTFKLVERDLDNVAHELKVQLSDLFDQADAVPIGKMLGAKVLIVTKLTIVAGGKEAQLFAKLLRVETGEVLSVAKADLKGGIVHRS